MSTFLRNKTISKTTPLREENPFPQFNVASHKRPGIRLSFEYTTTLLSGEGGEGRTGTATMFRKMLSKYTIFSTVLSKIVVSMGRLLFLAFLYRWCFWNKKSLDWPLTLTTQPLTSKLSDKPDSISILTPQLECSFHAIFTGCELDNHHKGCQWKIFQGP